MCEENRILKHKSQQHIFFHRILLCDHQGIFFWSFLGQCNSSWWKTAQAAGDGVRTQRVILLSIPPAVLSTSTLTSLGFLVSAWSGPGSIVTHAGLITRGNCCGHRAQNVKSGSTLLESVTAAAKEHPRCLMRSGRGQ